MKTGEFYRFTPHSGWCREGYARVTERGVLVDTYWGLDASEYDYKLTAGEAATAEFMFDAAGYDLLPIYDSYSQHRWAEFKPEDRQRVTSQHGHSLPFCFVRKGAKRDLGMRIQIARERLQEAQDKLSSAQFSIELRTRDLNELLTEESK